MKKSGSLIINASLDDENLKLGIKGEGDSEVIVKALPYAIIDLCKEVTENTDGFAQLITSLCAKTTVLASKEFNKEEEA